MALDTALYFADGWREPRRVSIVGNTLKLRRAEGASGRAPCLKTCQ